MDSIVDSLVKRKGHPPEEGKVSETLSVRSSIDPTELNVTAVLELGHSDNGANIVGRKRRMVANGTEVGSNSTERFSLLPDMLLNETIQL